MDIHTYTCIYICTLCVYIHIYTLCIYRYTSCIHVIHIMYIYILCLYIYISCIYGNTYMYILCICIYTLCIYIYPCLDGPCSPCTGAGYAEEVTNIAGSRNVAFDPMAMGIAKFTVNRAEHPHFS